MEIGPVLLVLLFVGVNIARKRIAVINEKAKQNSMEGNLGGLHPFQPQPAPFSEAAPVAPVQSDEREPYQPFSAYQPSMDHRLSDDIVNFESAETSLDKAVLPSMREQAVKPGQQAAHMPPQPGFIPVMNGQNLLQAVIAKEILTRPPSATRRYSSAKSKQAR